MPRALWRWARDRIRVDWALRFHLVFGVVVCIGCGERATIFEYNALCAFIWNLALPLTLWLRCARDGALADWALRLHLVPGVDPSIVAAADARPYSSRLSFALSVRVWQCHLHCGGAGGVTAFKLIGFCAFVGFLTLRLTFWLGWARDSIRVEWALRFPVVLGFAAGILVVATAFELFGPCVVI